MNTTPGATALRDVKVPEKFFKKIRLGKEMDELFGGDISPGLLRGSSNFITGAPGAGKSTWCLQLADMLQKAGETVLYNIGEENQFMVKMRADRLGCKADYLVSQEDDIVALFNLLKQQKVSVLFIDSIQTMRLAGQRGAKGLVTMTYMLQDLSKDHDIIVFAIGQCTKGGTFAGPNEVKHTLDSHLHLSISSLGTRSMEFEKNRFGPSKVPFEVELGPKGMTFVPKVQVVAATEAPKRGAGKREGVASVAKSKLLDGEAISGYCFERLGVACSGSFWRTMLKDACNSLLKDGYGIGEKTIEGRAFNYITKWK